MTPAESKALWEQVKANGRTLDACPRHDFENTTPEKTLGCRWRCRNCGGETDTVGRGWYERGLAHGAATHPPRAGEESNRG